MEGAGAEEIFFCNDNFHAKVTTGVIFGVWEKQNKPNQKDSKAKMPSLSSQLSVFL